MGTRGLTKVILDGKVQVCQYGQWDHYPSGVGGDILSFCRKLVNSDTLELFKNKVRALDKLTREADDVDSYDSNTFNRSLGPEVLDMILEGKAEAVLLDTEFEGNGLFCEGVGEINLDDMTYQFRGYTSEPTKWSLQNLPTFEEFVEDAEEDSHDY